MVVLGFISPLLSLEINHIKTYLQIRNTISDYIAKVEILEKKFIQTMQKVVDTKNFKKEIERENLFYF